MQFLEYIEKHYNEIHKLLSQYKDFNEDVFHNTILSCHKVFEERHLQFNVESDILRYFISSYKTNLLRSQIYYYNKNKNTLDETLDILDDNIEIAQSKIDLETITNIIKSKFPEDIANAYFRYIEEGISITQLQKETGIKNLKQKIKNIKEYVQTLKQDY